MSQQNKKGFYRRPIGKNFNACVKIFGFANQEVSANLNDGLHTAYITCAVKYVPTEHKPTNHEQLQYQSYLKHEIAELNNIEFLLPFSAYYKKVVIGAG